MIVLDTCLLLRNDLGQSKVPHFDYGLLERIIEDHQGAIFITPFSVPELYAFRKYQDADDLMVDLAKDAIGILNYNLKKLKVDFSGYSFVDRYAAVMIYHLTGFLEFFVLQVTLPLDLDEVESLSEKISEATTCFYDRYKAIGFENCTNFMKKDSIDYVVDCIRAVLHEYGKECEREDVWRLISETRVKNETPFREICDEYFRYARFLVSLFSKKVKAKAKKVKLSFGFNDLLIAHATDYGHIVLSSDKEMCRYLLKYGNEENREMIKRLWNNTLLPAEF